MRVPAYTLNIAVPLLKPCSTIITHTITAPLGSARIIVCVPVLYCIALL